MAATLLMYHGGLEIGMLISKLPKCTLYYILPPEESFTLEEVVLPEYGDVLLCFLSRYLMGCKKSTLFDRDFHPTGDELNITSQEIDDTLR